MSFSELILGFLDSFSTLIWCKGTHPFFFSGKKSSRDDVTTEIHKTSPLEAPLPVPKSDPTFTSFSLTKFFLQSTAFDMASLSKRNELTKVLSKVKCGQRSGPSRSAWINSTWRAMWGIGLVCALWRWTTGFWVLALPLSIYVTLDKWQNLPTSVSPSANV